MWPGLELPSVQGRRAHPQAHTLSRPIRKRPPCVSLRQPIDVGEVGVFLYLVDQATQARVPFPALVEDSQAQLWVEAHPAEPAASMVHVQKDATILPVVPRDHR